MQIKIYKQKHSNFNIKVKDQAEKSVKEKIFKKIFFYEKILGQSFPFECREWKYKRIYYIILDFLNCVSQGQICIPIWPIFGKIEKKVLLIYQ